MAVHKTHHIERVRKLQRLPAVVAAQTAAPGNLPDEFGPGRLAHGGERFLRHAQIVGVVAAREAIEPVAGKFRPGLVAKALATQGRIPNQEPSVPVKTQSSAAQTKTALLDNEFPA